MFKEVLSASKFLTKPLVIVGLVVALVVAKPMVLALLGFVASGVSWLQGALK